MINDPDYKMHAPGAVLDYSFNWGTEAGGVGKPWLEDGDTILSSEWTVTPAGMVLSQNTILDGQVAVTFAGGGTAGVDYYLKNTIVTVAGRIDSRTMVLRCRER